MTLDDLAKTVVAQARACNATMVTAESCTAGAVAHYLSKSPGAGAVLHGGFITYSKEMKSRLVGVPASLLVEKSAVCAEVAEAMAKGAVERSGADIAVAVTGVAGPEPDEDGNPPGLVYCAAFSRQTGSIMERRHLSNVDRDGVIRDSIEAALNLLRATCRPDRKIDRS